MLLTKRAHHCTIFQTLSALMRFRPINYAIFETTRSGSLEILHHFSVMKDIFSVFFQLKPRILWTKVTHRNAIFGLLSGWVKIHQIPHVIFGTNTPRAFSSNFASLFSVIKYNSSVFFHLSFICFGQKDLIKVQIFRLSTASMKINQIPYAIFQAICQFSFKICITFQCHDT